MDEKTTATLRMLRKQIAVTGYRGGMAHLASSYSCLEILYTLYAGGILRLNRDDPMWADRDRLILSKGHAGLALYAILTHMGFMREDEFSSYLQLKGCIGGEPCMRDSKWVEATTGSLGHGLSFAAGIAMALRLNHSLAKVYVVLGDGECEEGAVWGAAMSAAAHQLDNLVVILDCNEIQKMDRIDRIIGAPRWMEKWTSFGWSVEEMDGHDITVMRDHFSREGVKGRPRFILAHTIKGKGVSIMEQNPNWHFKLPNRKERKVFQEELGISEAEWEG